MVDNEQIKDIIKHFENEDGANVRVRDIAFTLLSKMFADNNIAYQCLFGSDGYEAYIADDMRAELEAYMTDMGYIRNMNADSDTGGISFEENRREMERLLAQTQQALDNGLIEAKDGLKIMADIRVKLTDKFKVESQKRDRMIIVEKKFSGICEYCHHEIYVPTIEELKEKYNLIEKQ
jgi:hypothetical protein